MNVSVVIPTYNAEHTVTRAVEQGLAQAGDGIAVEVILIFVAGFDPVLCTTSRYATYAPEVCRGMIAVEVRRASFSLVEGSE